MRVRGPRAAHAVARRPRAANLLRGSGHDHFTSLPAAPSQVSVAYHDLGDARSARRRGHACHVVGGHRRRDGTVTFRGPVRTLRIGGQELRIDQVGAR
jgi:hypothetical protein